MKVLKVLIVEDSKTAALVLQARLGRAPVCADVTAVASVEEARIAIDLFGPFDAAVLDVLLPDGRGEELLPLLGRARVAFATSSPEDVPAGARVTTKGPGWISSLEAFLLEVL